MGAGGTAPPIHYFTADALSLRLAWTAQEETEESNNDSFE